MDVGAAPGGWTGYLASLTKCPTRCSHPGTVSNFHPPGVTQGLCAPGGGSDNPGIKRAECSGSSVPFTGGASLDSSQLQGKPSAAEIGEGGKIFERNMQEQGKRPHRARPSNCQDFLSRKKLNFRTWSIMLNFRFNLMPRMNLVHVLPEKIH